MLFNLGLTRFLGFQNTIAAIRSGEWSRAASLAKQSLWYKQVGARARRIVRELDTGEFCPPE
jgi:lysozyme